MQSGNSPAPSARRAASGTTRRRRITRATAAPARNLTRAAFGIGEGDAPTAVARRDAALRRLLAMADILAASVAVLTAVVLIGDDLLRPAALALLPVVVLASRLMGLYDRDEIVLAKTTLNEGPALFHLATLYTLAVYIGQDVFVDGALRPVQGLGLWTAFFCSNVACRGLIRRVGVRHTEPERCLVLGDEERVRRVREKLAHGSALNAQVVLAVDPRQLPTGEEARTVLADLVRSNSVHRVILAAAELDNDRLLSLVRDMKALGVKVSVRPRLLDVIGSAIEFEHIHGDVFLGIRRFGLTGPERRMKRTLDIAASAFMLLMTAPLFAAFALAIRLDGHGPVFFRQERVGRDGRRFRIWKFRTMVHDAEQRKAELADRNEAGGLFKMADDPRVTRVGRLLRRTSLDELPQLLNVLRGEMSLVGPRPLVVDEDAQIEGWHRRRLHLTPGMTGMWQILGSARIPLHEMVALDYLYIVNWSLWNDIQILLRTVGFMLARRGL